MPIRKTVSDGVATRQSFGMEFGVMMHKLDLRVFCVAMGLIGLGAGSIDVRAGQMVVAEAGEWVQYSTPDPAGAEYVAVCLPAFSPETVNRDRG